MKSRFLLVVAVMLAGCATVPSREPLVARMEYLGARNDHALSGRLLPSSVFSSAGAEVGTNKSIVFPMSHAVECNSDKTDCRHAIVRSSVRWTITSMKRDRVHLVGALECAIGRTQTIESFVGGTGSRASQSISDDVEVIDERVALFPFDREVAIGEALDLDGLQGVKVRFSYHEPGDFGGLPDALMTPTLH